MRQGNGTDLLGPNHPDSTSIGVIYVSPTDDRKNVLAAILTQEKLGRKQVAVVLPEDNKAFQRPIDFDDLKSMRRKLQTEIVFIAPSGPGPAEFARQRRFPVYSSLESYTQALLEDNQASKNGKRAWLFSAGSKQKTGGAALADAETSGPTQPLPDEATQQPAPSMHGSALPFVAGTAAGLGAAASATTMQPHSQSVPAANGSQAPIAPSHTESEETLPPTPTAAVPVVPVAPVPAPAADGHAPAPANVPATAANGQQGVSGEAAEGPAIIELPAKKGKSTLKLPVSENAAPPPPVAAAPVVAPEAVAPPTKTPRRANRSFGAVGAAGAGAAAGGALAGRGAGGPPPSRGGSGGGGRGGGGRGGSNPRTRRNALVVIGLLLLTLALAFCSVAYAAPGAFGPLKGLIAALPRLQSPATVTITPDSQVITNNYVIAAVTGTPNPAQREVSARSLSATSPSQQKTVNATGVKQTPATAATGSLTFTNGAFQEQTVAADTVFTTAGGVRVVNTVPANIPAANIQTNTFGRVTVPGRALTAGAVGNIPAGAINGTCCSANGSIVVFSSAFSGGQDAQNFTFVQQSDIDNAAQPLEGPAIQQASKSLGAQVRSNEQYLTSPQCSPNVSSDQPAGAHAGRVTVTVSATCKAEVYDQKATESLVADLLQQKANTTLGQGYVLVGSITTKTTVQSVKNGNASLLVNAQGRWAYQITAAEQERLKSLIAGKSVSDAIAILKSQHGIRDVDIQVNGSTLPTDPGQINIVVQTVPGLPGGGGGGVSGTPTVTGPNGGSPTTQPGLGGG